MEATKIVAVISPAKTLDYVSVKDLPACTTPRFEQEAIYLAAEAAKLSKDDLKRIMGISDNLAELNAERFRQFAVAPQRQAIHAFNGDVYNGLDLKSFSAEDVLFAQDHLRILSGLYGLLRPLDALRPYRLEMGTKWSPLGVKLTAWWKTRIADMLTSDVGATGTILNLASQEYWDAVKGKLPYSIQVINIEFIAADGRFITMHAKTARGVMARWMIKNKVQDVNNLRDFDAASYKYDSATSTETKWVFKRGLEAVGPPY